MPAGCRVDVFDALEQMVVALTFPDLTFILDVPAEVGLAGRHAPAGARRCRAKRRTRSRSATSQFHERLREGYLAIAEAEPHRCVVIDGTAEPDAIFAAGLGARGAAACWRGRADGPRAPAVQETEALPEADRLEDFPHPRETRALFGHEAAERSWRRPLAGGRMHHAWLLAGRRASARRRWPIGWPGMCWRGPRSAMRPGRAWRWAPRPPPRGRSAPCRIRGCCCCAGPTTRARSASRPSIPVDEVRRLQIVPGADRGRGRLARGDRRCRRRAQHQRGQCAAEVAGGAADRARCSCWSSSEPSRLLPTIRSRSRGWTCRRWRRSRSSAAECRRRWRLRIRNCPSDNDGRGWSGSPKGSVRRALQLAASGGLELHERIEALLRALPKVDWPAVHTLSDQLALGANEQRFEAFFDLLLDRWRGWCAPRATGQGGARRTGAGRAADPRGTAAGLGGAVGGASCAKERDAALLNLDKQGADPGHVRAAGGGGARLIACHPGIRASDIRDQHAKVPLSPWRPGLRATRSAGMTRFGIRVT